MKKFLTVVVAALALTCLTPVFAAEKAAKELIENWFAAMKAQQFDKAAEFLAPEFVSIHTDGIVRDKNAEMELIKKLNMKNFKLTDFAVKSSGEVVTVTYKAKTDETIDNKKVADKPAGRMAVLQKQGDSWLIIAYANLDMIG